MNRDRSPGYERANELAGIADVGGRDGCVTGCDVLLDGLGRRGRDLRLDGGPLECCKYARRADCTANYGSVHRDHVGGTCVGGGTVDRWRHCAWCTVVEVKNTHTLSRHRMRACWRPTFTERSNDAESRRR